MEIVSPTYVALRDGNQMMLAHAAPAPDYVAPAFRVRYPTSAIREAREHR